MWKDWIAVLKLKVSKASKLFECLSAQFCACVIVISFEPNQVCWCTVTIKRLIANKAGIHTDNNNTTYSITRHKMAGLQLTVSQGTKWQVFAMWADKSCSLSCWLCWLCMTVGLGDKYLYSVLSLNPFGPVILPLLSCASPHLCCDNFSWVHFQISCQNSRISVAYFCIASQMWGVVFVFLCKCYLVIT